MPSSYTQSLRLILPVTGELTGTWGDAVNAGLTELVEDAIAGSATIAMANANVTLTTANEAADQARNMFLNLTGAHTAQRDVIVPAVSKLYFVHNGTTGGFGVQVKTAAGSGVVVPNGQRMALYCDGTNVLFAFGSSVGQALVMAVSEAAGRAAIGADIYKTLPISSSGLVSGEVNVVTAGFTLNTGLTVGDTYVVYNDSASNLTITQGSGLTLRLAGTTSTGNRTLLARGMSTLWVRSTTEYIISGGVA